MHLFPRLPRLRVRTDVEGVTGKRPPRTGVYVSQDDPYATLQFAWTGNEDGLLGDAQTFNEVGKRLIAEVGRDALWVDHTRLIPFALREIARNPDLDTGIVSHDAIRADPQRAGNAMSFAVFTSRPCKWYFVEKIDGEFDNEAASATVPPVSTMRLRCEAGQPCPREGYWSTAAKRGSRRRFAQGEPMPSVGGDYGVTIWQWEG